MRILILNYGSGGIFSIRATSFASAMVRRGHSVLVLMPSSAHEGEDLALDRAEFGRLLRTHCWKDPLVVALRVPQVKVFETLYNRPIIPYLRKAITALQFIKYGGTYREWTKAVESLAPEISDFFKPEVIWVLFGTTSNLTAGQSLARFMGVPWFMDLQDNWQNYVRSPLRELFSWRFRDAAGYTSNAETYAQSAAISFPQMKRLVIYSGAADGMAAGPHATARSDLFVLSLIGSTYREDILRRYLNVLAHWLCRLNPDDRARVLFRYSGSAAESVRLCLAQLDWPTRTEITKNIPYEDLAALCQSAAANCYLWLPGGFHHKMLELLATRRPVISFPGELPESIALAQQAGGELLACESDEQLTAAFETMWQRWKAGDLHGRDVDLTALDWDAGAAKLEAFFAQDVRHS